MTKEQAIKLGESKFWENLTFDEIAMFQISEPLLCMPFHIFHEAVEKTLKRPVFTHEFGLDYEGLKKELLGERNAPSLKEIINLIPKEKQVLIQL